MMNNPSEGNVALHCTVFVFVYEQTSGFECGVSHCDICEEIAAVALCLLRLAFVHVDLTRLNEAADLGDPHTIRLDRHC